MVRFSYYEMFLKLWDGYQLDTVVMCSPISAVIWAYPDQLESLLLSISNSTFPARLIMHIVIASGDDYPINYLRNLGIPKIGGIISSD